ncbi:Putative glycerol kinase 5, variant 2 [Chamberlinius hualienensis]
MRLGSKLLYLLTRRSRFLGASVLRIHNKHISMRLLWMMDNIPNLREKSDKGDVLFGTIDTWLVWKLTGGKVHATDYSMASSSAMYDPYIKEWAGWAFNLFSIPRNIMPEVVDTSGKFGNCLENIFDTALPILAVAGDQQAATFGHCCFDAGDMKCTLGTGTFFDINTGPKPHTSMAGLYPLIGWKYGSVTSYLAEGSSNDTGVAIQWAQTIGLINNPSESETLAESVSNSNGVSFVPGFSGLQTPVNNDLACAGIIGLKYNTKREEIVRAVIESLGFRVKQLFETILREVDFPLHDIRVDGGVAQNNFLMQLIADLTGKTVDRSSHADMSCLGVALFSGLAAGVWKDEAELKSLRNSERIFKPKPLSAELQFSLSEWNRAVQRCLDWYTSDVQFI